MDINWAAFIGVALLAYLIPGPDMAVILRAATRGLRAGVAAACGAQLGLGVHATLAVAGLSVVLAAHPGALTAVRLAGGAYLLFLGGRLIIPTLRRRPGDPSAATLDTSASTRSVFGQALFTNLLNPKAVLFFAAVLPQFVSAGGAPVGVQVAVLGALDVSLGFLAWAVVVAVGVRLSALLRRERVRRWWDRVTGTALGGIGGGLIVSR